MRTSIASASRWLRQRVRFGLRTLLLVVTLLALWLGWLVQRVERQRRAVDEIERRYGRVVYAHQYAHEKALFQTAKLNQGNLEAPPSGPAWLRPSLSPHYFQNVENIYLDLQLHQSEDGWPLGDLPGMKRLLITRGAVTAAQLRSIGQARSLEELHLINTKVDISTGRYLSELRRLKRIDILSVSFTAQAFQELCAAPSVHHFTIIGGSVEPEGFAGLRLLENVRFLDAENVAMRDEDVRHLAAMPRLRFAGLIRTGITPQGIAELQRERPQLELVYVEK